MILLAALCCAGCQTQTGQTDPDARRLQMRVCAANPPQTRAGEPVTDTWHPGDGSYTADDFTAFTDTQAKIAVWCAAYTPAVNFQPEYSEDFILRGSLFSHYVPTNFPAGVFASASAEAYWRLGKMHNFYIFTPACSVSNQLKIDFTMDESGIEQAKAEFAYARMMGRSFNPAEPNLDVYLIPQLAQLKIDIKYAATVQDPAAYIITGVRVRTCSSAQFDIATGLWQLSNDMTWITKRRYTDLHEHSVEAYDQTIKLFPNTATTAQTPTQTILADMQICINNVWYTVTNIISSADGIIPFTPGFKTTLTITVNKTNTDRNNLMVTFTHWHSGDSYQGVLE